MSYKQQYYDALTKEKLKYDKLQQDILKNPNYNPIQQRYLSIQYCYKASKLNELRKKVKELPADIFIPRRFPKPELLAIKLACPEINIYDHAKSTNFSERTDIR